MNRGMRFGEHRVWAFYQIHGSLRIGNVDRKNCCGLCYSAIRIKSKRLKKGKFTVEVLGEKTRKEEFNWKVDKMLDIHLY